MANKAAAVLIVVFLITVLIIAGGSHSNLNPFAEVTPEAVLTEAPTANVAAAATSEVTPEATTAAEATSEITAAAASTEQATAAVTPEATAVAQVTVEATSAATAASTSAATATAEATTEATPEATVTASSGTSAGLVGDAAHGQMIFEKGLNGAPACVNCHNRTTSGKVGFAIGPGLKGISDRATTRVDGLSAPEYIEQSIRSPGDYVVKGFQPIMYGQFAEKYSDQDIADLVAYLMTL